MKVHVTYVSPNRRGLPTSRVFELETETIVLGRGSDANIQLSDPRILQQQATITKIDDDFIFNSADELITKINGASASTGKAALGSFIELGPYVILFTAPGDGYDLAILIELVVPLGDGRDRMISSAHRIHDTKLSMKAICWVTSILFVIGAIVWPLVEGLAPEKSGPEAETSSPMSVLAALPSSSWVWQSGALSSSHRFLGEQCTSCHTTPFAGVNNSSCLSCHETTNHHVHPDDVSLPEIQNGNCVDCHTEHHAGTDLVQSSQQFCTACHSDLKNTYDETELIDVNHGLVNHPAFKTTVVTDASVGKRERTVLSKHRVVLEKSNLRFPHHVHVAKAGIQVPGTEERRLLVCADCHVPDGGGRKMAPVQMEQHCSDCHKLEFDPAAKGRVLPHGQPARIPALITDYFLGQEVNKAKDRLEYGVSKADPSGKDTEVHRAIKRATERQQQTLDFVFNSVCGTCHTPIKQETKTGVKWDIEPVIISQSWFPKAQYDHSAHRSVPCAQCHTAQTSKLSSDILMPNQETCLQCHGDQNKVTRVQSNCLTCHAFHLEDLPPFEEAGMEK